MTTMDLMLAFGELDDRYVQMPKTAAHKARQRRRGARLAAAAACAAVALGSGLYVWQVAQTTPAVVYPSCNVQASDHTNPLYAQLCLLPLYARDVLAMSDAVVVADVKAVEIKNQHVSLVRLSVTDVLFGSIRCGEEIVVQEIVLYKDIADTDNYGTPDRGLRMEEGNRVLLFLKEKMIESTQETEHGVYELADSYFCKYFYDTDGRYHLSASYGNHVLSSDIVALLRDYKPRTAEEYRELFSVHADGSQTTAFTGQYPTANACSDGSPYLYLIP